MSSVSTGDVIRRSAEKTRLNSSCTLADRIAQVVLSTYNEQCSSELREAYRQTVLAGIVLQLPSIDGQPSELHVLSFGVGTKVRSAEALLEERRMSPLGEESVRDMHAEVLARRGFIRWLLEAVSCRESTLLEWSETGQPMLPTGSHLHLYTSSQPCGNATIKRWAKTKAPKFRDDLGTDGIPSDPHPPFSVTAREQGQVSLLVKKNAISQSNEKERGEIDSPPLKRPALIDGNLLQSDKGLYFPIGTWPAVDSSCESACVVGGCVMSCSDKIASWNALGVQGPWGASLFTAPLHFASVVVGRKFSSSTCERALCCRIARFRYPPKNKKEINEVEPLFATTHPSMLCTVLKFDAGAVEVDTGAQFEEFRCFVAWKSTKKDDSSPTSYSSQILDGKTGRTIEEKEPLISSRALAEQFLVASTSVLPADTVVEWKRIYKESGYSALKCVISPDYSSARALLRSTLFTEWIQKPARPNCSVTD